jgi:hypothetical protein
MRERRQAMAGKAWHGAAGRIGPANEAVVRGIPQHTLSSFIIPQPALAKMSELYRSASSFSQLYHP